MDIKIKDFLTESNWTKGQFARDEHNIGCSWEDEKAVKFCLLGAAHKCYTNEAEMLHFMLERELRGDAIIWQDAPERTFAEVSALVKKLDI